MAPTQILIVGAGPVGLTTALALRQGGVAAGAILVADRRPSRDLGHAWSKALSVSASSLEVFRILGIAERFLAAGFPIHQAHFGAGERLLDLGYEVVGTRHPFNLSIPQNKTEEILLQRCEEVGVRFAWGREMVGLTPAEHQVLVTFKRHGGSGTAAEDRETVGVPWVIGCDGTRSAVREAAGIIWDSTKATRWSWVADCAVDNDPPPLSTAQDERGRALVLKFSPGKFRFTGIFSPAEVLGGRHPPAPDLEYVRNWAKRTFRADYGLRDVHWAGVAGDGTSVAAAFRSGRVFVAGDAAHSFFPAGGQGMNTGLLDAANLAWKLAMVVTGRIVDQVAVERVLDSYTKERLPAVRAVVHNVQVQMSSVFGTDEKERAVSEFIAEALDNAALNRLWATRATGFGDPTQPYRQDIHDSSDGEELVGSRLTHITACYEDAFLQAAHDNVYLLAFVQQQTGNGHEAQWDALANATAKKYKGKVKILDRTVETTSQKWSSVQAILVRPDLRIAWVSTGGDALTNEEALTRTLSWCFGNES